MFFPSAAGRGSDERGRWPAQRRLCCFRSVSPPSLTLTCTPAWTPTRGPSRLLLLGPGCVASDPSLCSPDPPTFQPIVFASEKLPVLICDNMCCCCVLPRLQLSLALIFQMSAVTPAIVSAAIAAPVFTSTLVFSPGYYSVLPFLQPAPVPSSSVFSPTRISNTPSTSAVTPEPSSLPVHRPFPRHYRSRCPNVTSPSSRKPPPPSFSLSQSLP